MKILQITNKVPYPENDGGAIACMNMLRGLHSNGNKVTLLSMVTLKHPVALEDIPTEVKSIADIHLVAVPAPITILGGLKNLLFSRLPYNAQRFIDKTFREKLVNLIQQQPFDLIQFEGLYVCPYIHIARENTTAKIVYRAHNIEHEIWERTARITKGIKKWYLRNLSKRIRRFEGSFINKYDLLVPITSRDGDMLNRMGNTKPVQVSQTGIDVSKFTANKSGSVEYPSLFHIGALDWSPNQEGLIWFLENCWPAILKQKPEIKFYIAGRKAPEWLKSKLVQPNIFFEGEVDDAHEFMRAKAIMIVPLLSGSGMRIKIIEGMALGKTIVSTSIGTEGINTSHNMDILIADNAKEFIHSVLQAAKNKSMFEEIGKNAHKFIHENFNNLVITEQLANFYKKHL